MIPIAFEKKSTEPLFDCIQVFSWNGKRDLWIVISSLMYTRSIEDLCHTTKTKNLKQGTVREYYRFVLVHKTSEPPAMMGC